MLPDVYSDFADVFEEKSAETLPPHHPYDCPVDLIPRKEVPLGCIYAMSFPQLAALKVYIKNNLVCVGSSALLLHCWGPCIFFHEKEGQVSPALQR